MLEGILDQISIGQESAINTPVTPTISVAILPSDGIKVEQEQVGVEAIDTSPAKNKDFHDGICEYPGSFEVNAFPQILGYLLKSALGGVDSAVVDGETVVYKHTFTETIEKASVTLEQKIGNLINRYAGFIVSKLSINIKVGESVKVSFEGRAMSEASATAITPVYETTKTFDWTDVQSIMIGLVDAKAAISEIKIEYSNGLNSYHSLASKAPSFLYCENSEVNVSITASLTEDMEDLRAAFLAGTQQSVVITLTADETIGSASHNSLVITLPKAVFNTYENKIDTKYSELSSELICGKDATNGLIKVELTNLVDEY